MVSYLLVCEITHFWRHFFLPLDMFTQQPGNWQSWAGVSTTNPKLLGSSIPTIMCIYIYIDMPRLYRYIYIYNYICTSWIHIFTYIHTDMEEPNGYNMCSKRPDKRKVESHQNNDESCFYLFGSYYGLGIIMYNPYWTTQRPAFFNIQ